MSGIFEGKQFIKISELTPATDFVGVDEFVFVQNGTTLKLTGQSITDSVTAIGNLVSKGYVDTLVDSVVDSAPGTLDTLRELAFALNDDENFASHIIGTVNNKLTTTDFTTYFDSEFAAKNTYHLAEGSNLYYTQERFDTAFAGKNTYHLAEGSNLYYTQERFDTAFSGKSTDDLAEGSNLYFTDDRARESFSAGNGISITSGEISSNIVSSDGEVVIANGNGHGGAGYAGVLTLTNTSNGATNINKFIRLNSTGNFEIINSAYSASIFTVTDDGQTQLGTGGLRFSDGSVMTTAATGSGGSTYTLPTATTSVLGGVKVGSGLSIVNGVLNVTATVAGGSFTSLSTTDLTVQNVTFSGSGAVALNSNNDLNINAVGTINLGSITALPSKTRTQLAAITSVPAGSIAYCSNATGGACPVWFNGTSWLKISDNGAI